MTHVSAEEVSVPLDADLKEALSRMLGLGFHSIPVTDGDGRLVGEVSLDSIEQAVADSHDPPTGGLG